MTPAKTSLSENIKQLAEVAFIDMPLAATVSLFRRAADKDLTEAGWKAYESATAIANELIERAQANPTVNDFAAGLTFRTLRARRALDAVSGAFFATLWPAMGVPTARDLAAVRNELKALRAELREAAAEARDAQLAARAEELARENARAREFPYTLTEESWAAAINRDGQSGRNGSEEGRNHVGF